MPEEPLIVTAVGYPQSETSVSAEQAAYDILAFTKTPLGFFLGLVRLDSLADWLRTQRQEALVRQGTNPCSYICTRLRTSGGVEKFHPRILTPFTKIVGTNASFEGTYPKGNGILSIQTLRDPDLHWGYFYEPPATPPANIASKLGLHIQSSTVAPADRKFVKALEAAFYAELDAKRGLQLDWNKIPIRELNSIEVASRHCRLSTFQSRTSYLDDAIIV